MRSVRKPSFQFLVSIAVAALVLSGCGATDLPQSMFAQQGDHSQAIYQLFWPIFYLGLAVFVIVEGLLVYAAIRYRRRPQDGIPVQIHGNTTIEIAWTILPAILVLFIAVLSFRTQAQIVRAGDNPLKVTVTGKQWWWEFKYPGQQIITANELHLPANRDVELSITSTDVIHSFWMPRIAGTTDALPGQINRLVVKPLDNQRVIVRGECKEFCGGTHAMMGFYVVVEPQAEFDAWVKQQQAAARVPGGVQQTAAPAATVAAASPGAVDATETATVGGDTNVGESDTATPDRGVETATAIASTAAENQATAEAQSEVQPVSLEARGYQLFQTKACVGCHAINGYPGAVARVGPDLTHVGSREYIVAGWLKNTPDNMRRWLRDPAEVKPDNIMATVVKLGYLKEDEIDALTAYLESLK